MTANGFDPEKPFIASDGLEYLCVADKILGEPIKSWRNLRIQEERSKGASEEAIREWIKFYDGDDPRTSVDLSSRERAERHASVNTYGRFVL